MELTQNTNPIEYVTPPDLSAYIAKDGSTVDISGNIPMNDKRIVGLAAGIYADDAVKMSQLPTMPDVSVYIKKDGSTNDISGNIPLNAHKLTGLTAGSENGDSVRYEQLIARAQIVFPNANVLNAIDVSPGGWYTLDTPLQAVIGVNRALVLFRVTGASNMSPLVTMAAYDETGDYYTSWAVGDAYPAINKCRVHGQEGSQGKGYILCMTDSSGRVKLTTDGSGNDYKISLDVIAYIK